MYEGRSNTDDVMIRSLKKAILASLDITNKNLVSMHHKLIKRGDHARMILNSEAISLFKGSFIKLLKQLYTPSEVSRIKTSIDYVISLDHVTSTVDNLRMVFGPGYMINNTYRHIQLHVTEANAQITLTEMEYSAKMAIMDYFQSHKDKEVIEDLPITKIEDIKLDNLSSFKF